MTKNLKINDLEQQQQIKPLSDEELLEKLGVMVVRDAGPTHQNSNHFIQ